MEAESFKIETGGWQVSTGWHHAVGEARGVVIGFHAMMTHRRTLDRPSGSGLASALTAAGWHVYLVDFRGHGRSGPGAQEGGSWTYDDLVQRDIPAVCREIARRHPDLPRVGLGHSLGGHGLLAALGHKQGLGLSAVVTLATNVWTPGWSRSRAEAARRRAILWAWTALSTLVGRYPARAMKFGSDDEALPYVRQLYRVMATGRWAGLDDVDYAAGLPRVTVPVLAIASDGDTWMCPPACARMFHATLGGPVTFWETGQEFGVRPDHMGLVLSQESRPVWDGISGWLAGLAGVGSPRGAQGRG